MGERFRRLGVVAGLVLGAAACAPKAPVGVDQAALERAMGAAVGDVGVCVIVVRRSDGGDIWRHGAYDACHAKLATCGSAAPASGADRIREAAAGVAVTTSCSADTPGRSIAWALGPAGAPGRGLAYVAVLQAADERALPGRELATRVEGAFATAGL